MIKTTKEQRRKLADKFKQSDVHSHAHHYDATGFLIAKTIRYAGYRHFRKNVQGTYGCDGAIVVYWCNMWLCIEKDGYCHS